MVVETYAFGKTAGTRDLKLVFTPLQVQRPPSGVVAVGQGVSERFPKSSLGVRRHRHAEEAELQFFLAIPRSEAAEYFLGQSKKR
ncbi:MAG TPA: hypothetical protein VGJ13_20680, partial [Pseudonocardiaceae bacterium]